MIAAVCCAILLLAVHNVVIERLSPWMYVPACITVAAGLVGLGAAAGLSAADMGLTFATSSRTPGSSWGWLRRWSS